MNKVLIILTLLLLMTVSLFAQSRAYYQRVVAEDPNIDLRTIVLNSYNTNCPIYEITATILETNETISTNQLQPNNVHISRVGTAPEDYVVVFVQLGAFPTQWVTGETLHINVSKTDEIPIQSTSWDFIIPEGTFTINIQNPTQNVPPLNQTLPVELSSFTAVATAENYVHLQWTTQSETNLLGFNVFRSGNNNLDNAIQVNQSIIPGTNTTTTQNYSFIDSSVELNTMYYFWLDMVEFSGIHTLCGPVSVFTATEADPTTQAQPVTALKNAYPNPFGVYTVTNIACDVKMGETATISIYNVLGRTVKNYSLHSGLNQIVQWNGKDERGRICSSGVYFYQLSAGKTKITKKLVILDY